jgi:hypothetical protein
VRAPTSEPPPCDDLLVAFRAARALTLELARPLSAEDQQAQAFPDASPTKWHLAHTTWFFERFVVSAVVDPRWEFAFNSYYEAVGPRHRVRRAGCSRARRWSRS